MLVLRAGRFGFGASAQATTLLLALALAGFGLGAAGARFLTGARAFAVGRAAAGLVAAVAPAAVLFLSASPGLASTWAPAASIAGALLFAIPAGATIPLLFAWANGSAARAGALVAANALGGVGGALLGGLVGPTSLGTAISGVGVLGLDLAAAALAASAPALFRERPGDSIAIAPALRRARLAPMLLAAGAGATTLAYEGLLARLAPFYLGPRSDALATVLAASFVGLALGARLAGEAIRRGGTRVAARPILAAAVLVGPLALAAIDALGSIRAAVALSSPASHLAARVVVGGALAIVPLAAAGALSPLAFALAPGRDVERVSRLNVAYAVGAVLAAFALPALLEAGLSTPSLIGGAGLAIVPGALALFGAPALALVAVATSGALLGWGSVTARVPPFRASPTLEVIEAREGPVGVATAALDRRRHERTLLTDAFRAAATGDDYRYTRSLAHLPLLLAEREPRRAAILAFGTGSTAAAALLHADVSCDLVEISGEVFDLARHFPPSSDALFQVPGGPFVSRARTVIDDARRFLAGSSDAYDLIAVEPLLPDTPAGYPFYTREFYALAAARLAPGGALAQWVPIHATEPRSFRACLATFVPAFPHRAVFLVGESLLLLGSARPLALAPARLDRALASPRLAVDLRRAGCSTAGDIVAQCVLGDAGLGAFADGAPLRDDRAAIERLGYFEPGAIVTFEGENLEALIRARAQAADELLPGMEPLAAGEREARRGAGTHYLRARRAAVDPAAADPGVGGAQAHPFAALDALRRAGARDVVEGRKSLVLGEIARAEAAFAEGARLTRDPLPRLGLAVALEIGGKAAEADVESAIAAALLPSAPRVMRVAWDEIRGSVAATAAAVFERGAAIAARAPALPPSIPQIAAALASHEAISRVAATVALARHRDELAVEVETWAESVVARTPAQAAWALAVGRALDDPTLGPSLARLEAAAR